MSAKSHLENIWVGSVQRITFPLILIVSLVAMSYAPELGIPQPLMQLIIFISTILIVALSEHFIPYSQIWRQKVGKDRRIDIASFITAVGVVFPLLNAVAPSFIAMFMIIFVDIADVGIFPNIGPFVVQVLVAALIAEFGAYWMHRWSHQGGLLWRFHAVHHSAKRIYWLNSYRSHPVNIAWHFLAGVFILMLLGTPENVLFGYAALSAIVSVFQHANADFKYGFLSYIFSTNEVHRWHHSTKMREANNNYGNVLMIWDLVFRTYFNPTLKAPSMVGLSGQSLMPDDSFWKLMFVPFQHKYWKKPE